MGNLQRQYESHGFIRSDERRIQSFDPSRLDCNRRHAMNVKGEISVLQQRGYTPGFCAHGTGHYTTFEPPQALQTFPAGHYGGEIVAPTISTFMKRLRGGTRWRSSLDGPNAIGTFPEVSTPGSDHGRLPRNSARWVREDRDGELTTSTRWLHSHRPRAINCRERSP